MGANTRLEFFVSVVKMVAPEFAQAAKILWHKLSV
jgi:hypothetical protein